MAKTVPIAIVGMSCRLPGGANSPEQLWEMLHAGRSGHGPIPETRWNADAFYHGDPGARESVPFRTGHFLQGDDISAFDARFFRVAPRDANGMDPQQRLLLEATYEALENAGMTLDAVRGSDTAVVMAEFARDYDRMAQKDVPNVHKMHVLGYGDAILANRISYTMDLRGPSFTLDTGCVCLSHYMPLIGTLLTLFSRAAWWPSIRPARASGPASPVWPLRAGAS